jgi:ATP-binding cassette subfamily C protein
MTAGVGLLLIIPLLNLIGFSLGSELGHGVGKVLTHLYQFFQIPLSMSAICITYTLVISVVALSAYAEERISIQLQQQYIHYLRIRLYKLLLNAKWTFFLQKKIPDLIHNLTIQIQAVGVCNYQLLTLINCGVMVVIYIFLALIVSWKITCIAIVCAILLLSILLPLHKITSKTGEVQLQRNMSIFQSISEQLGAIKMIKGSRFEEKFLDETIRISTSLEEQSQKLTKLSATTKLLYACGSVSTFSFLLYLAIEVFKMPATSLLLILVVFSRILPSISLFQQGYQRLLLQLPSYNTIRQLSLDCLANQENLVDSTEKTPVLREAIRVHDLSFSYALAEQRLFHQRSFTIHKNTITAITGFSGIGKSTLIDLIVGLLEPSQGSIYIDEVELNVKNRLAWRKSIAYITQDTFLFNTSIRENLQLFCEKVSDIEIWEALKSAAAADFVARLKEGLETIVGDRGIRLSGGEIQRIVFARALLAKSQLLVLDESTRSLDSNNMTAIQESLLKLKDKMTIIIISHQPEMSDFADRIINLVSQEESVIATEEMV